jgi:hypothetical protein
MFVKPGIVQVPTPGSGTDDVIHSIRKLAREIHRRSVWQVLGIYLLLSVAVIEAVTLLSRYVGLPLWTPTMATVLMALGLPMVLATAVVQGGISWLRIEDAGDPSELTGRSPAEVHVIPEAHPLYGVSLFTWRNAILGGMMSLALLVASVVAYLAMWATGVGPIGSLIAQGLLAENDTIVVAAFENLTDDDGLAARVHETLAIALARSTAITVIVEHDIAEAVHAADRRIGRERDAELARAFADHGEIRAFVTGDVSRVRGAFRLETRIVRADGTTLARFRETTSGPEELLAGIDRLSARLRERIGESLRAIGQDLSPSSKATSSKSSSNPIPSVEGR